jgi:hypothetical protein
LQRSIEVIITNFMLPMTQASALGQRYFPHVGDICAGIARVAAQFRLLSPMLLLAWLRLRNTQARLDRLAIRWQQNRLHPTRKRLNAARKPRPIQPADPEHPRRTPQSHAWLIRLHQPLAQWAPRIDMLVNDPDIAALCAAAPQAGRLLRPLCRMFGLTPPSHILRPAAPRKPRPRKPKVPKPPPFAEHSPSKWPFVPHRLRLRVPGLRRRRSSA